jgi:ferric-dicitrate binding protein FerR (iron transport regulator)
LASTAGPSTSRARERKRDRRAARRRRFLRGAGLLLLLALVFFAGIALGRAFDDKADTSDQTSIRTLVPTTLTPPETVTVTTSKP